MGRQRGYTVWLGHRSAGQQGFSGDTIVADDIELFVVLCDAQLYSNVLDHPEIMKHPFRTFTKGAVFQFEHAQVGLQMSGELVNC